MFKKMLVLAGIALVAMAAPAAAGGWAVSTLDQPPTELVAGQDQAVGFTIRQHGVTPVNPDSGDIGLALTPPGGGAPLRFLAAQVGPAGHFVATVNVPTTGAWTWEVLQGWFEPQPLGTIDVVATAGAGAAAGSSPVAGAPTAQSAAASGGTEWWRIVAVVLAGILAIAFLVELVLGRRRRDRDGHAAATA
jgi:hypothetical protein